MRLPNQPDRETSARARLLATCAGPAVLATAVAVPLVLLSASVDGGARAQDCTAYADYGCYFSVQPAPAPNGKNPGTPGTAVGAATANIPGVPYQTGRSILIQSIGGQGGTGYSTTTLEEEGADGGRGGDGNTLTVTMQPGTTTGEITAIQADGGAGGSAGYSGHQTAVHTSGDGGTAGTVVAGTVAAPMMGQLNNPAAPPAPNSGNRPSVGLYAGASGGVGADGVGQTSGSNDNGGNAGNGGNSSGGVNVVFGGSVSGTQGGILAISQGGNGGNGGAPYKTFPVGATGGNGGNGGTSGNVYVVLTPGGSASTTGTGAAITAQSFGGQGGQGGQGGTGENSAGGGQAGTGADGGNVIIVNYGSVSTTSADSPGILAQSFGGAGGNGGKGGGWGASGGNGGTGGSGAAIVFTAASVSSITTGGTNAPGVLLQSVGGGGGNGGDSDGWLAVGGDGAGAGNGRAITIYKSTDANGASPITTTGERSTGILAQSVGGGGGNGGNASSTAIGPLNLVIGGSGAGGGDGGAVQAATTGNITTSGLHSSGIVLQSIGGGGGNGGAAYSGTTSAAVGASVAVGGSGGGGGAGGPVGLVPNGTSLLPTSTGRILTSGANAYGIVGQSLGGGGGIGGLSGATAKTYSAATEEVPVPTISVAVSIGGSGGSGGTGNSVTLVNNGLIATAGGGAIGIAAQSVGGGGGGGGDASATSSAKGGDDSPVNISSSVAIGGRGGTGGAAGPVSVTNSGLIFTRGEAADPLLAQSIGGGGGAGGTGDAQAKSSGDGTNIAAAVSLGGSGGSGGNGNPVSVANTGALLALGDGAVGIMAQSIGGGGGRAGGAAGTSNGQFSASVSIGGSGGSGGSGNTVTIGNSGTLVTFGADAPGIVAQSIGGGGGLGGKSASSLGSSKSTGDGGNGTSASVNVTTSAIAAAFDAGGSGALNQYNSISGLVGLSNAALGSVTLTRQLGDDPASDAGDLENLGGSAGNSGDGSSSTNITVHVNVGGRGGAAGSGSGVTISNTGSIGTVGPMSDGILAQSIGGGGGKGGVAVSSITSGKVNADDTSGNVPVSVGGRGGGGGNGGDVLVTNSGSVITTGSQSLGIVAQSIAGGGGIAGTSAAKVQGSNAYNTSVLSLPIAIGADGGGGGTAGTVTVNTSGTIITRSHDAVGILAQSISGGGGIVRTRSSDASDNNGGLPVATGGSYNINFTFGGQICGTTCGAPNELPIGPSGAVYVNNTGSITTSGANAYGILAQSIGGGGGVALGGLPTGSKFFSSYVMTGDADQANGVQVVLGNNDGSGAPGSAGNITTSGQGAVAVFAQSIGGGGGLAGDTGLTAQRQGFASASQNSGNGGPVYVAVRPSAILSTDAGNTPVILAQSIGGGGGRVTNAAIGAFDGTAGGTGTGNTVHIAVGGQVLANGVASPGIFAESVGQSSPQNPTGGNAMQINIYQSSGYVRGGTDFSPGDGYSAGIYLVGGGTQSNTHNLIDNFGTITSLGATAIYSTGGWTDVNNQGGATISGSIDLENGNGGGSCTGVGTCVLNGGNVSNAVGGTINTGPLLHLSAAGTLANAGTLNIGGTGRIATTAMTGNLVQGSTGRLVVDTDHQTGASDHLDVQGSAKLGGTVEVHPATVANRAVTVLTATNGVTIDPGLTSTRTYLYRFDALQAGNSVQVQPRAEFSAQAASLGANQRNIAVHLQQLWDRGTDMTGGFTALSTIKDGTSYRAGLNSLAGGSVGGVVATRQAASERFSNNLVNCEPHSGTDVLLREESCVWLRTEGNRTDLGGNGDAPGYRQDSVTHQLGGQKEITPGWFVGASGGYETSWLKSSDDGSKVSGQSALFGVMLKRQAGPWTLTGVADGGYGWYQSRRQINVGSVTGQASGSPAVAQAGLHLRAAYQVNLGGSWYARPNLAVSAIYRSVSGYSEAGSTPFNLTVRGSSDVIGAGSPMLEVGRGGIVPGLGALRGFMSVGATFSPNNDWKGRASFQSAPAGADTFTATSRLPAAVAKLQAGLDLFTVHEAAVKLTYDAAIAPGYVSQSLVGRLAYAF